MRKPLAVLIMAGVLFGCATGSSPTSTAANAVIASSAVLTAAQLAAVEATCVAAAPGLAAATAPSAPASVSGVAIYPAGYCKALLAAAPGMVPATTTSGTPAWLTTTLTIAEDAAKVAGVVIPLLP